MAKSLGTARFDLPAIFPGPLAENGKRSEQRESGEHDPAHVAPSPPRASFSNTPKSLAARPAVSPKSRPPAEAALFFFEGAFLRVASSSRCLRWAHERKRPGNRGAPIFNRSEPQAASCHLALDFCGALDGFDHAGELGQDAVAHELHDTTLVLCSGRNDQL
jgi:hypothetical protein